MTWRLSFYSTNQILFPSFHAFHTKFYLEIVLGRAVELVMALAATLRKYRLTFLERKGESWQSSSYDLAERDSSLTRRVTGTLPATCSSSRSELSLESDQTKSIYCIRGEFEALSYIKKSPVVASS
jgi:hypothetical protein